MKGDRKEGNMGGRGEVKGRQGEGPDVAWEPCYEVVVRIPTAP